MAIVGYGEGGGYAARFTGFPLGDGGFWVEFEASTSSAEGFEVEVAFGATAGGEGRGDFHGFFYVLSCGAPDSSPWLGFSAISDSHGAGGVGMEKPLVAFGAEPDIAVCFENDVARGSVGADAFEDG